ncbi:hybrid sensor histidine kinase/response regulator [Pseudosulfitobacter koreensis]|uniref:histidine kinase n=1 Tax=Pseudosulfitobacter koreensis TaxID=2968472 RepID=A0ABT1YYU6_9RHOB|nr:hybrid sensor histidine kinase/response regulator [Pseudosulfitobacter koreense]MCR8826026.1 response regulator [Pseudosulfitobacter koreense]
MSQRAESHIDTLAQISSVHISQQAERQDLDTIQKVLNQLVASDDLVGARVSGLSPDDMIAGLSDDIALPVMASAALGHTVNGTYQPLGMLTLYGSLGSARQDSMLRAFFILCIAGLCTVLIALMIIVMLSRSVMRPLTEIDQWLRDLDPSRPDAAARFSTTSQRHMIAPLRHVVDAIESLRARITQSDQLTRQQQKELTRAVDIARLGYASYDVTQRRFTGCDAAFAEMLGLSVDEILTADGFDLARSDLLLDFDEESSAERHAALARGETVTATYRIMLRSGKIRIVRAIIEPVPGPDDSPPMLELVAQDVTEMHLAEQRANQAEHMSTLGNLTGGVAHDFNNLLAIISGNIELTELSQSEAERAEYIDNALSAVARGAALTQQLLAFARNQPLSPAEIDPHSFLTSVLPRLRKAVGAAITIKVPVETGGWTLHADATQLEASLVNLALNAADAMPEGGILTITIDNREIDRFQARQIPGSEPGEYVSIEVADTGEGMSPAVAAKAFDPFFTTKSVGRGTGMGLAMVLGFAQQSGGFATLNTIEGRGTAVRICLPRAQVQATFGISPGETGPEGCTRGRAALKDRHVLLIEDEDQLRILYAGQLEAMGCRVTQTTSAVHALVTARKIDPPDIILSDIVLPGGSNGIELAETLVQFFPDAKVIFVSGFSENAMLNNGMLAAGGVLLQKPFGRSKLETTLVNAILQQTRTVDL